MAALKRVLVAWRRQQFEENYFAIIVYFTAVEICSVCVLTFAWVVDLDSLNLNHDTDLAQTENVALQFKLIM